jgi:DNA-directed RNA polymerase specialized sigma24 family protein
VLRFYCDLTIDQTAQVLTCSPGTVKSQTAKGLESLRRALDPAGASGAELGRLAAQGRREGEGGG